MITGRRNGGLETRERCFIAFEGVKSEPQYFNGLRDAWRKDINVEIVPLLRGIGKENCSNPRDIVDMMHDYVHWVDTGKYSTDLFIEQVLNSAAKGASALQRSKIDGKLFSKLKNELKRTAFADEKEINDPDEALLFCIDCLKNEVEMTGGLDLEQRPKPTPGSKYCLVVDRDAGSFTEGQCEYVRKECEKNNYMLIISNPCFELWLLLHFDVKREEIMKQMWIKHGLKRLLRDKAGIEKGEPCFDRYKDNIGMALKKLKEDKYCEDLGLLSLPLTPSWGCASSIYVGTNIGTLMDYLFVNGIPRV